LLPQSAAIFSPAAIVRSSFSGEGDRGLGAAQHGYCAFSLTTRRRSRRALAAKHSAPVLASVATYADRLRTVLAPVNLRENRSRLSVFAPAVQPEAKRMRQSPR
jgi:hypothetical protein